MISFFAIPSILKDKVKKDFPEAILFVAEDMDASQHGKKPRKKREKLTTKDYNLARPESTSEP
jgi:hypothetical protein